MIAWTTESMTIRLPVDLTGAQAVVSVEQFADFSTAPTVIKDESPTVTVSDGQTTVEAVFTQAQTGQLRAGVAKVQCNWVFSDGTRDAMAEVEVEVRHNQLQAVMTYAT